MPVGLLSYMLFLWKEFGNPFLFIWAQDAWGRKTGFVLARVWEEIVSHYHDIVRPDTDNMAYLLSNSFDFFAFWFAFIFSIIIFFKLRKSYGLFGFF